MTLILSRDEIKSLLNLSKAIELTEDAFKQQANGQVVTHTPYHIPVGGRGALRVVSGALLGSRRVGVRMGASSGLGGGDRMYAALFDTESGELLSFMGFPFGTLRTAAHVALAAKCMAREDAQHLGLFGVGRNALGILKALASVRPIKEIYVSSRDPERRKKFCDEAVQQLGIKVQGVDNPEQAVRGMEVVLTATNSLTPIFPESWVESGTHVSSMGKPTELSHGLHLKASRIVVGSQEQERNYSNSSVALPLVELTAEGKLSWSRIPELGELVSGRVPGRESRDEINIFRESQGGYGDIAFAAWIYEEALRRKLGRELEL
ncbi:MAG TPA: ornithine cyclodeaminase family protein [Candidatus Acidoferrales bacterium]|jgi:alanine dehydrogenase|nr:ornithine cyclodeaminase family protein [Candidatus Acidoferrales bacterium]